MSDEERVRVLIADDHPLVLGALREAVIAATPGAEISEAHDFDSLAPRSKTRRTWISCCSI